MDAFEEYEATYKLNCEAMYYIETFCRRLTGSFVGWKMKYETPRFEYESGYFLRNCVVGEFTSPYFIFDRRPPLVRKLDRGLFAVFQYLKIVDLINWYRLRVFNLAYKKATEKFPEADLYYPFNEEFNPCR